MIRVVKTLAQTATCQWKNWLVALFTGLSLFSIQGYAHQQKLSFTTIAYNFNTNNIEVMHRFLLHDAEHATKLIFNKNADIIASEATRDEFSTYIEKTFRLTIYPESSQALTLVGNETDGRYLWIYQEMPMPNTIDTVEIRHDALQEIWPDQTNRVNIELGETTETLIFTTRNPIQSIQISR